eukprot:1159322-Pelagomonas_calceolata.AAC.8
MIGLPYGILLPCLIKANFCCCTSEPHNPPINAAAEVSSNCCGSGKPRVASIGPAKGSAYSDMGAAAGQQFTKAWVTWSLQMFDATSCGCTLNPAPTHWVTSNMRRHTSKSSAATAPSWRGGSCQGYISSSAEQKREGLSCAVAQIFPPGSLDCATNRGKYYTTNNGLSKPCRQQLCMAASLPSVTIR